MTYAHSVTRVTIHGRVPSAADDWTTGFYLGLPDADVSNPTQQLADAIKAAWQTFFTAATSQTSAYWDTTEVKLAQLAPDGKTFLDNTVFSTYAAPISGTKTTPIFPPQVSLVATLQSTLSRGLAAKGRMFLPAIVATVGINGHIAATDTQNIAGNLATFFNAVNTASGPAGRVILASKGRGPAGTGALNQPVTRIRVGDVYDTQRRRRNGFTESYSTTNLA